MGDIWQRLQDCTNHAVILILHPCCFAAVICG